MTHKLSRPEVDDFVENFDKANQAQVLSNVQEQREMLIQLLGEQQYEQFKDPCTNAVRASLSDSEPPPESRTT